MTPSEIAQWLERKIAQHEAKYQVKKRRYQRTPPLTVRMFQLTLHRLALQTIANRESRGWTQHQLAMRAGLKVQLIRTVERGKEFGVTIHTLHHLARAFGCAVEIQFKSVGDELKRLEESIAPQDLVVPSFDEELAARIPKEDTHA